MKLIKILINTSWLILFANTILFAQPGSKLNDKITAAMMQATKFMANNASENGGYVSLYLPDFSRRWGELEALPTMVWVQNPGTVSMGNVFLDAYFATQDEYYYKQAEKAARALIWGQLPCGGWNYLIDFGGEKSTLNWYNTIGKNAWRLEEFQHYYGNATFDDEATVGAASFLLRFYLTKMDPAIRGSLEKAIKFVLKSQYPLGGWPQRYPLRYDFNKAGHPDYTSFYTFNDNVCFENLKFLVACYATLNFPGKVSNDPDNLLDAIQRGMNFFLLTQQPKPLAGWGQQYTMDLKPAAARTYEPAALDPQYTANNIEILLKFYRMTGDKRYIERLPDAINWLKETKLRKTDKEGVYVFAKFIDPRTGKPIYSHRIGSDVSFGHYYMDKDSTNTVGHYGNFRQINLQQIEDDYQKVLKMDAASITEGSPIKPGNVDSKPLAERYSEVLNYFKFPGNRSQRISPDEKTVNTIISSLDHKGRWMVSGMYTSNPYIGEPQKSDANTRKYMTTHVGDKYDTSPYRDTSSQKYISTAVYSSNMRMLIEFLNQQPGKLAGIN